MDGIVRRRGMMQEHQNAVNPYEVTLSAGDLVLFYKQGWYENDNSSCGISINTRVNNTRSIVACVRGDKGYGVTNNGALIESESSYFPIPVPSDASKATFTITPASLQMSLNRRLLQDNGKYGSVVSATGWAAGSGSISFTPGANYSIQATVRYNSSNGNFPATNPITEIVITFER